MIARTAWRWLTRLFRPPPCYDHPDTVCRDRGVCNWLGECLVTGHRRVRGQMPDATIGVVAATVVGGDCVAGGGDCAAGG